MKKYFLFIALAFCLQTNAQDSSKIVYPLVISFESHCCGVPSDSVIRNSSTPIKTAKIKSLTAVRIGPMGRKANTTWHSDWERSKRKKQQDFITRISQLKP